MTLQDMRFDTVLCDTNGKKEIKAGLLYAAIREGRFHIAHYLIEHGARYCSEELPLMVAIAFFCDPRKDLSQNDQDCASTK
ncbi:MAG UNVERIFIED_CONTAM: hypothetical protein LVQ98_02865 [Rickettsiaceae bacterium]|jgi:endonuclease III